MKEKLLGFLEKTITYSFYLLFFLVPIILTPYNYELFEYNKMMLVYGITLITICASLGKMILRKEVKIARTPLDLPLLLFLLSQIISTLFSIDPHVSIWGYYSRFNGGLVSTISYILLYYTFVTNFPKEKIVKLLKIALFSGSLVAIYGVLEHLGIDRDIWVQDVQNRVFSTLGQPNWLAAYLAILIPITIAFTLNHKLEAPNSKKIQNTNISNSNAGFGNWNLFGIWNLGFGICSFIFYLTLLFTKSRSGFIGLWTSLIVLWSIFLFLSLRSKSLKSQTQNSTHIHAIASICVQQIKLIGIYILSFIFISFFIGTPFAEVNRFTFSSLFSNSQPTTYNSQSSKPLGSSVIEIGITESGTIRRIVWQGAVDIFKRYPLFGTGVETFAFSYYQFRPIEHNLTSEWDFLYNKAHNEYLNYAATTGIFGLGSYLLIIGIFIWWNVINIKDQISSRSNRDKNTDQKSKIESNNLQPTTYNLQLALFAAWLSILVTNFFGFSVVLIQLFFFLIPAISFVLSGNITSFALPYSLKRVTRGEGLPARAKRIPGAYASDGSTEGQDPNYNRAKLVQYISLIILLFVLCYLLFALTRTWYADTLFAEGYRFSRNGEYTLGYQKLREALLLNSSEPLYYDEFALPAAQLATAFYETGDSTTSAQLTKEAILTSDQAITTSPGNVNFWKSRTRVFYALSQIDKMYLSRGREALEKARDLSPTDPKISYNLAILLDREEKKEEAIALLEETTRLKPDYRDAFFALALFYEQNKEREKAKEMFNYILTRISPNDEDVKKQLEGLK